MGDREQDGNRLDASLAGWHGELSMRHIDTYMGIMGAMPMVNPWWIDVDDNRGDLIVTNASAHQFVGWRVHVTEWDADTGVTEGPYIINHERLLTALEYIRNHPSEFRSEVVNATRHLFNLGWEYAKYDFDSDTADVVVQWAVFGEIKYS